MSKQTAVEWLINQHFGSIENCTPDFRMKIQKAKKMEKQQIIDFAKKCLQENDCFFDIEQYYDETFKK